MPYEEALPIFVSPISFLIATYASMTRTTATRRVTIPPDRTSHNRNNHVDRFKDKLNNSDQGRGCNSQKLGRTM